MSNHLIQNLSTRHENYSGLFTNQIYMVDMGGISKPAFEEFK